jgi:broad specificity phosphatase PhoE
MRPILLTALLFLFAALVARGALAQPATTVILVRHAEKAAEPAEDPPLSAAGETRAQALLDLVREAGISAVITTPFARTRDTARPVLDAL